MKKPFTIEMLSTPEDIKAGVFRARIGIQPSANLIVLPIDEPAEPDGNDLYAMVRRLYATPEGICGCCLHVVLDDGNWEDEHVQFCIDRAATKGHAFCKELGERILAIPEAERDAATRRNGFYSSDRPGRP